MVSWAYFPLWVHWGLAGVFVQYHLLGTQADNSIISMPASTITWVEVTPVTSAYVLLIKSHGHA